MVAADVLLDSVQKVKDFSSAIIQTGAECELVQGARILDAKSIMGIFSLDLSKPIRLRIDADLPEIPQNLKQFLAKK